MNVVILTALDVRASFIIHQIEQQFPVRAILRVVASPESTPTEPPAASSRFPKILEGAAKGPLRAVGAFADRLIDWYRCNANRQVKRLLGHGKTPPPAAEIFDIPANQVNSPQTVELMESLETDLLIVCGAPVLKPQIFEAPRLGTINVHFGMVPHYRGQDTLFWPLYFEDYANIGMTLHYIDRGVDTGAIVAQGWPALAPTDTEATLTIKCMHLASDFLIRYLSSEFTAIEPDDGAEQQPGGRTFTRRERTRWHGLKAAFRRYILRRRPPVLPERIRWSVNLGAREPVSTRS